MKYVNQLFSGGVDMEVIQENEGIEYLRMLTDLAPEEIVRLQGRFKEISNGEETMTKEAFMKIEAIARNPLKERIATLCGFDHDLVKLTSDEFVVAIGQFNSPGKREDKLKLAFRLHDLNDDGVITQNDLKEYITITTIESISTEDIQETINNVFKEFEPSTRRKGINIADFQLVVGASDFHTKLIIPI